MEPTETSMISTQNVGATPTKEIMVITRKGPPRINNRVL